MALSVIVYQYGKVASTSLVATLNRMRGVQAHQCHFFGKDAFLSTVSRLCNPHTNDYFFKHSLGQLNENLRVYRQYHHKHRDAEERFIVVTVAREPFDWFKSSVLQEIEGHLANFRLALEAEQSRQMGDRELVTSGLALVFSRIHQALDTVGGDINGLTVARRRDLNQHIPFADADDFEAFLFILSRYLQPHVWFQTQFTPEFGVVPTEMETVAGGLRRSDTEKGPVYLIQYERMEEAFAALCALEGLPSKSLSRANTGADKHYASEVSAAFASAEALRLKERTVSDISRLFE